MAGNSLRGVADRNRFTPDRAAMATCSEASGGSSRHLEEIAILDQTECQAQLAQLVDRLPDDQRPVIRRRFIDQRSIREIAQELGRSEGAIKQLQFRAIANLRDQMRSRHA